MSVADTAKKPKKSLFGGASAIWFAAIACALVAAFVVVGILGKATARTTYWTLGVDVPARAQITPDMLREVTSTIDGAPKVALTPAYVRDNAVFAKVPMQVGDVLSTSTVGPLERIDTGLPKNFVATSFSVTPENAVAGKVRKGDYVDLIAVTGDEASNASAKVVLHHVLVLDVTVSPQTISEAANAGQEGADLNPGPESNAVRGGIPSLYTVAVTSVDAAKIALVRDKKLMLNLSANDASTALNATANLADMFSEDAVSNSGAGTEEAAKAAKEQAAAEGTGTSQQDTGDAVTPTN